MGSLRSRCHSSVVAWLVLACGGACALPSAQPTDAGTTNPTDGGVAESSTTDAASEGSSDSGSADTGYPNEGGTRMGCVTSKFSISPARSYDPGMGSDVVRAGDLNGDGKADLVAQGSTLLNKGDGTFAAPVPYNAAYLTFGLGDVTGDGTLDIVEPLQFLPGNGDGTFGIAVQLPGTSGFEGNSAVEEHVGDLNGDKINDIVLNDGRIGVLLGSGGGQFASPVMYGSNSDDKLAFADFNGDGQPDIVGVEASNGPGQSIEVLVNAGGGTFPQGTKYMSPTASTSSGCTIGVGAGDFNGDGKGDFAVVAMTDCEGGSSSSAVDVFLNKGDGTFDSNKAHSYAISQDSVGSLLAADLNSDGNVDLVAGVGAFSGNVAVFMGKGDGTFAPAVAIGTKSAPLTVVTADFLGNGFLGIATIDYSYSGTMNTSPIDVMLPSCH
jgi:hypothetical protein